MTAAPLWPSPPAEPAGAGDDDDAQLIVRSRARPEVFAGLYDRHAPGLHRYVTRRLGRDLADDVVGETFLIAFRGREDYDISRPQARPWLYGIAANLISRHRRSELRAYRALARSGADPVALTYATDPDAVDGRLVAQAAGAALAAALRALSDGDRHVLLLVAWEDFSYAEVADALGIPIGTVRSRLNRARRKMRSALGDTHPVYAPEGDHHG
ncbi:RNA polymerase sigma factor [Streptomyces sp. NBC_01198]|uniref:RNA polymerase sigma factor n=1 Tax=Streptomyces sp. NBC_01198 TaxID=2903769 RepID=UPI002E0DD9B0|nr:RNA polymerase sigma factor [Streptomyces sp. NBC_01198]